MICVKKWTDLWIFCHYYHYYDDLLFIVLFRFLYCNLFPKSRQPSFCYFCWDVTYWQERCHKMTLNSMYSSHKFEFFNLWMSLTTNFIVAGRHFKYMQINRIIISYLRTYNFISITIFRSIFIINLIKPIVSRPKPATHK